MALRKGNVCHYVGQTEAHPQTRLNQHDKVQEHDRLYIGRIVTSGIPGPNPQQVPRDLRAAEHALIFVLQPEDNVHWMRTPPEDLVVVYGRVFDRSGSRVNPPAKFPILVTYDPESGKSVLLKGRTRG